MAGRDEFSPGAVQKGVFNVGQEVVGPGIPAGTTVVGRSETSSSIPVLSAPATITAEVGLSVFAHGSGSLVSGANEVTAVANIGEFVAGQTITGAGIPAATTITAVNEAEGKLALSAEATASGAAVALTATWTRKLAVGEEVTGSGIPAGATVISVAADGDPTLSANATSSGSPDLQSGVPFNVSAATLKSILESATGAGNVEVTGAAGGPWEVEFKGRYADTKIEISDVGGAGLTPSGTVEVKTVTRGASGSESCTAAEVAEGYLCLPGVAGHGPGQLDGGSAPLSVDPVTHDLWVGGLDRLQAFGEAGEYLSEVKLPGAGELTALAVDAAGDLYTLTSPAGEGDERAELTDPRETAYTLTVGGDRTLTISAPPVRKKSKRRSKRSRRSAGATYESYIGPPVRRHVLARVHRKRAT